MAKVNSGGVEIAYEILNADSPKVPIFFVAGLNGMRGSCMKQGALFSSERPVVLHDHRGTGESGKPLGVYSVENMAADVIAIMDHAGIKSAHIVGTSLGGAITQVLCIDYPDRVRSAGIICSFLYADHFMRRQFEMRRRILQAMGSEALMLLTSTTLNDPKFFTEHYDEILEKEKYLRSKAPPLAVEAERIEAILKFDQRRRLGEIRIPVIVIGAKNDAVCPSHYSEQLAAIIPAAELKLYEDGGHFFYLIYADQFNADIRGFISKYE